MAVTGVGSSFSYIYNTKTGKIFSKDGKDDEFVRYFNNDLSEEESETLNGFDRAKRAQIRNMVKLWQQGVFQGGLNPDSDEQEISGKIIDAATEEYYVNGQRAVTSYSGMMYTPEEFPGLWKHQSYKTQESRGYDPADNSIHLAVGDIYDLWDGYRLKVGKDCVEVEGYGSGSREDDEKAALAARGLGALIAFSDGLTFSAWIPKESTPMLLDLLRKLGVDTDKEFMINQTRCEVRDRRIREVNGNRSGASNASYEKALKRYEETMLVCLVDKKAEKTENKNSNGTDVLDVF